jgi:hypothetical protein
MIGRVAAPWVIVIAGASPSDGRILGQNICRLDDRFRAFPVDATETIIRMGYHRQYVDKVVQSAFELIFEDNHKAKGFCDHFGKRCFSEAVTGTDSCNKKQNEYCERKKPRLVVICYREHSGKEILIESCRRFSFLVEIPAGRWRDALAGHRFLSDTIGQLKKRREYLQPLIESGPEKIRSPVMLPVSNFQCRKTPIKHLIRAATDLSSENVATENVAMMHALLRKNTEKKTVFVDDRQLGFRPATFAQHGLASISDEDRRDLPFCLSTFFRLGLPYYERLHYEVSWRTEPDKALNLWFQCARRDEVKITKNHVNIYPNDWVR